MLWVLVLCLFLFFQKRRWDRELAKSEEALKATEEVCDLREEFYRFFTMVPGDLELILRREEILELFEKLIGAEQKFTETHLYVDNEPWIASLIKWKQSRFGNGFDQILK